MKKTLFRIMIPMILAGLVFTSCKKDEASTTPAGSNTTDLVFEIAETDFVNLKNSNAEVPECSPLSMDYVQFIIDDGGTLTTYTSEIFTANGKLLTQVVRVELGLNVDSKTIILKEFLVFNFGDDGVIGGTGDDADILLRAAPAPGSLYHGLMVNPLNITVDILKFVKKEIKVDVLCYEDLYYDNFGFVWFNPNLVKIERQCWFGDICTGKLEQYGGSLYASQSQGLQMDMPAIMKIDIFKKLEIADPYVFVRSFENKYVPDALGNPTDVLWLGEGDCMEVFWANDEDLTEYFRFDLYVWLPVGDDMDWVLMESFPFLDDDCPDPGNDNVNDFVVGYCQLGDVDFTYIPYQNLPINPITMTLGNKWGNNSNSGGYVDISFIASEIAGTDLDVGVVPMVGWCADKDETINVPGTYTVQVIGSLNVATTSPLLDKISKEDLSKINWLFNNLEIWYAGINKLNIKSTHPGKAMFIQNAIWALIGDIGAPTSGDAKLMYDAAQSWIDFKPMPGDYAAVYLYTAPHVQTLFVQVDP